MKGKERLLFSERTYSMAEQPDEILSRLRGISSEEKSEMGKMKCRIDDQARLIMMLKKRNDEYILSNMTLDKHAMDLEQQIDQLKDQLEEQDSTKYQIEQLRLTIEQLKTSNHQWQLKEQQANERFTFENEQYRQLQRDILSFKQQIQQLQQLLLYFSFRFLQVKSFFYSLENRMKIVIR